MDAFKFPDEKTNDNPEDFQVEIEGEGGAEAEIEVVDDTPEADRGRAPMVDPPNEVTDEELEKYTESVRTRIKHFSKGYHEERRAKEAAQREKEEAIRLAQSLVEENKKLQGSLGQGQQVMLEQAKKVAATEIEQAKQKLKAAHEAGDTDAFVAAQEELTAAKIRAERFNTIKTLAPPEESVVQPETQGRPQPAIVTPDPDALAWQKSNSWFGTNRRMTAVALEVHQELAESGVRVGSEEYYKRIDKEMRETFPGAFKTQEDRPAKKPSVVAPVSRSTAPKKIVLTQSQVNIAKRLGLTNEQYARAVADEMRKQNA